MTEKANGIDNNEKNQEINDQNDKIKKEEEITNNAAQDIIMKKTKEEIVLLKVLEDHWVCT